MTELVRKDEFPCYVFNSLYNYNFVVPFRYYYHNNAFYYSDKIFQNNTFK